MKTKETLQTGKSETVAALQAITVPAHRYNIITTWQSAKIKGQTIRQNPVILPTFKSVGHCKKSNKSV